LRDAGGDQTGPRADEQSSCLIRRANARAAPAFAGHQPSRAGDQKLHQPGQDDGPGDDQREFKLKNAHAGRQCGRRHHDDIEYHRADRDGADASFGIESRGQNGHQPRQQNIGRGNEQQKGRYGPAVRIESGRDDAHDERRENDDRQRDDAVTHSIANRLRQVNRLALASPSSAERSVSQIGTKAPLSAPSASRRRRN